MSARTYLKAWFEDCSKVEDQVQCETISTAIRPVLMVLPAVLKSCTQHVHVIGHELNKRESAGAWLMKYSCKLQVG